ncbi:MAG: hypothetical protein R6V05_04860 [Candidatus Brocadiia bacterium]
MHKHEHWEMRLHDDAELAELLGSPVREREVLQQWPLSQVERVETADGPAIYKCQCGPTVEPEFYAAARSPLLDGAGLSAREHLPPEVVRMREFLGVGWMVECQTRWIPSATSYDGQIARLVRDEEDAVEQAGGDL